MQKNYVVRKNSSTGPGYGSDRARRLFHMHGYVRAGAGGVAESSDGGDALELV